MSDSTSEKLETLRQNGPTKITEINVSELDSSARKQVDTISVTGGPGGGGNTMSVGGGLTDVIYLPNEHDFKQVIQEWVEVNKEAIKEITPISLRYKLRGAVSQKQRELVSDTLAELGYTVDRSDRGGSKSTDFECPFCDNTVSDLSTHLTKCSDK